ncbi:MAG: CapA family protein, partial [Lachnospiraceae bacterium]|nr:CapA family protein [Lachnospiraceae bacterium]
MSERAESESAKDSGNINDESAEAPESEEPDASEPVDTETADAEPQKEEPKEPTYATVMFTGDVLLSDYVLNNYDSSGINGVVDKALLKKLKKADILAINNEFPYSTRGSKAPDKQFTFRVDPKYVSVIKEMGVDIAGLANNHVLDFGKDALSDTFETLDSAGIPYIGAGDSRERARKLQIEEIAGMKIGFLAASRVIPV